MCTLTDLVQSDGIQQTLNGHDTDAAPTHTDIIHHTAPPPNLSETITETSSISTEKT